MSLRIFTSILLLLNIFLGMNMLHAQKNVQWISSETIPYNVQKKAKICTKVAHIHQLESKLIGITKYYQSQGYVNFSIDSLREDSANFYVYPYFGKRYDAAYFVIDSATVSVLNRALVHKTVPTRLAIANYNTFSEKLLEELENNGFPFAQISLQNIALESDTLAMVHVELNDRIYYDSIVVKGSARLRNIFLRPYLNWRKNAAYNEKNVVQIAEKLKMLPYISLTHDPGVEFVDNHAILYVFADKQRVNQFDGYLGIVPENEKSGKVSFNGELNLSLQNICTIGEKIFIHWKSPERYSQYLNIALEFPYLFFTPIGLSGGFILDKKDTTYLNMNYTIGLQYGFGGSNYFKAYFDYTTSDILLQNPEIHLSDSTNFNYRRSMYGISLFYSKVDNAIQPHSGVVLHMEGALGTRKLQKNTLLEQNIQMKGSRTRYRMIGSLTGFIPIHKRWSFVVGVQGGTLLGSDIVYNELFKIGGTQTLQGFNEMSIYASSFVITAIDLRFWMATWSYLTIFFNAAWYERNVVGGYVTDFPFGFGLGVNFRTKAGNFYISYALGQQRHNPISFKTGKIHFGLEVHF